MSNIAFLNDIPPRHNARVEKPIIVKDYGEFTGKIIGFRGEFKNSVILKLNTKERQSFKIATSELAQELAQHYLKNLRLTGEGTWQRANDEWTLLDFTVQGFQILNNKNLWEVTQELREICKGGWIDEENLLARVCL
jgi:hypothetical protein